MVYLTASELTLNTERFTVRPAGDYSPMFGETPTNYKVYDNKDGVLVGKPRSYQAALQEADKMNREIT